MNLMNLPDKPPVLTPKTLKSFLLGQQAWYPEIWGEFWLAPVSGLMTSKALVVMDVALELAPAECFCKGFWHLVDQQYNWAKHPENMMLCMVAYMLRSGPHDQHQELLQCLEYCLKQGDDRLYEEATTYSRTTRTLAQACLIHRPRIGLFKLLCDHYSESAFQAERPSWEALLCDLRKEDQAAVWSVIQTREQSWLHSALPSSPPEGESRPRCRL